MNDRDRTFSWPFIAQHFGFSDYAAVLEAACNSIWDSMQYLGRPDGQVILAVGDHFDTKETAS